MKRLVVLGVALAMSGWSYGEPLLPHVIGHDFNFGAYNQEPNTWEWSTNGVEPDTLVYTQYSPALAQGDEEVNGYWPNWPSPPSYTVLDLNGAADSAGDFVLAVQFDGQDSTSGSYVSLTGSGLNTDPGAADLEIYGTINLGSQTVSGLLWAIDLGDVSLYGPDQVNTYVLEGIGTIVGGLIADEYDLIGQAGGMRGHVDFFGASDWIPGQYDPLQDDRDVQIRTAYSGETGQLVPEPAAIALLVGGLALLRRR